MKIFKKEKIKIYLPLIISLTMIIGIILGNLFAGLRVKSIISSEISKHTNRNGFGISQGIQLAPKNDKISSALYYVLNDYVDTVSVNEINEDVIPAILDNLDPHSVYIPAQEFQRYNEPLTGNFSGIGVQFNMTDDSVAIISTIPNGPSEIVGIIPGDRIIAVDDSVVAGVNMPSDDIVAMLKGKKGTSVRVKVFRRGEAQPIDFDIIRDDIPLYSVDVHYMIDEEIGYIKISQFAQTTYREFLEAAEALKAAGMKKVIVDLRGNGGGIMEAAIDIADQFLPDGRLIVYTEGRSRPRRNEYASAKGILKEDKVIILQDELSASASEILAGALQDNDRGMIIGRRSFGKGLVQEQMKFTDGSALRLTVAKYYTPTGRSIQKPYTEDREDYYMDLNNRFIHGEFENADSIQFSDSLKFVTPGGKIVYGGGGIMPDIFVPVDTLGITEYYNKVRALGLIYRFAFNYTDQYREAMSGLNTAEALSSYLDDQNLKADFIAYASGKGIQVNYPQFRESEEVILTQIKAYIARNMIDNIGFYPIIRSIDTTLKAAIDTLTSL